MISITLFFSWLNHRGKPLSPLSLRSNLGGNLAPFILRIISPSSQIGSLTWLRMRIINYEWDTPVQLFILLKHTLFLINSCVVLRVKNDPLPCLAVEKIPSTIFFQLELLLLFLKGPHRHKKWCFVFVCFHVGWTPPGSKACLAGHFWPVNYKWKNMIKLNWNES